MNSASGDWRDPLKQLHEGIQKLRDFADREPDGAKREDLSTKIADLERRAENYVSVMERKDASNG